jgi:acyl-CoA reductase-like NAD-dependent aldehyde dehydrogenase
MFDTKLLIDERDSDASDAGVFERHNPMSGELVTRAAAATVADAQAAATAAAAAFPAWSALGPSERRAKLMRAADVLETRVDDFIAAMAAETGATAGWAKHNVRLAANMLREAAAMTTHITGEVIPSDEGVLALAVRQPAGVVLGIAPWNGPVILGVRAIAMAPSAATPSF